jgi:serine/threonine protein phosphatase PrpC
MRVVDSRPEAISPLQDLQTAWLENPQLDPTDVPSAQMTPAHAFPYLALQAGYFPAVPEVHDAFHHGNYTALLIEDRSTWPNLTKCWAQPGQDEALQQIRWLFEMTLLWEALIPWRREATLLQTKRLVIDSNHLLCLTHIDPTPGASTLPLKKLGESWQQLFHITGGSPIALETIVSDLVVGSITTVHDLKESLAALAQQWVTSPLQNLSTEYDAGSLQPAPDLGKNSSTQSTASVWEAASVATSHDSKGQDSKAQDSKAQDSKAKDDSAAAEDLSVDRGVVREAPMPAAEISGEKADLPEIPTMVLPMKLAQVDEVGLSHVGMQRNHNEDYFFSRTKSLKINTVSGITLDTRGLYIVCDGMGGHASGEVASQLAVETLSSFFETHWQDDLPDPKTLADAVFAANQAIYDINQTNATSGLGRMGTTLVMLLVQNLSVAVVHVGDSRLYSYCKRQGLKQLTLDHEVGQREINRGIEPEIAYARPDAYQLTQALGPRHRDEVKPGISYHNIAEDTLFLLCSDGLSDNKLLERHETSHIAPMLSSKANLDNSLENLIDLANEHNGHDNITAIVTRLKLKPDMTTLPR